MAPSLITSDLHRSANPRDRYRHQWHDELMAMVRKYQVRRVIVLGDITERKDFHGAALTNRIVEDFVELAKLCEVLVLQGNHDYLGSADNPFFGFMSLLRGPIEWIRETDGWNLDGLGKCLFVPHQRSVKSWDVIPELKKRWDWLFTHATFVGAHSESGEKLDGVSLDVVKDQRVVSGDVHVPQTLGKGLVTYVGAPYHIKFGDAYDPRVLLLEGRHMRSISCSGPRKVVVELTSPARPDRSIIEVRRGDIVKFRYKVAAAEYDHWPELRKQIEQWADRAEVTLDSITPVPLLDGSSGTRPRIKPDVRSDNEVVTSYCRRYKVNEETEKVGQEIIGRA